MEFRVDYAGILHQVESINPIEYGRSRNYTDGAVTRLSPYISRGAISARQVLQTLLRNGYSIDSMDRLIQELAWREYFQRVHQHLENDLLEDIRRRFTGIRNRQIPQAVLMAETQIEAIDEGIKKLLQTGYLHNHLRMYIASLICNIARSHWQAPAAWMYYHLLDGDVASNHCNWQWVAGTFSTKQYFCNQENINRFTGTAQKGSYLDVPYEVLPIMAIPAQLLKTSSFTAGTVLPEKKPVAIDTSLPVFLYNSYQLDPLWHADKPGNRILLLEPSHFKEFPVSERVIEFILQLAQNIENIQVFVGEVTEIPGIREVPAIYHREHPLFKHYPGIRDERAWLFPEVNGYYDSFSKFWKACQPSLSKWKTEQLVSVTQ